MQHTCFFFPRTNGWMSEWNGSWPRLPRELLVCAMLAKEPPHLHASWCEVMLIVIELDDAMASNEIQCQDAMAACGKCDMVMVVIVNHSITVPCIAGPLIYAVQLHVEDLDAIDHACVSDLE